MTTPSPVFTSTDLVAAASEILKTGGYQQILRSVPDWDCLTARLFENEYNVVGIVVFDTCSELLQRWPNLQGALVDVISQHVSQGESKSWDGYLVLMTPSLAPSGMGEVDAVRHNTVRLRKLVATGDDLRSLADIDRVLGPLLPLGQKETNLSQESALDLLPALLIDQGIPMETTQRLVDAFREQAPLLERLNQLRRLQ